jgi:hypothetical protein
VNWGLLAVVAATIGVIFGAYKYGESAGEARANAAEARDAEVARIAADVATTGAAKALTGLDAKLGSIRQEIQRGTRSNPVYVDCRHPPEQLRRLNEILTGARAVAPGASGVRASPDSLDQR